MGSADLSARCARFGAVLLLLLRRGLLVLLHRRLEEGVGRALLLGLAHPRAGHPLLSLSGAGRALRVSVGAEGGGLLVRRPSDPRVAVRANGCAAHEFAAEMDGERDLLDSNALDLGKLVD